MLSKKKMCLLILAFAFPFLIRDGLFEVLSGVDNLPHYSPWIGLFASTIGFGCLVLSCWKEAKGYTVFCVMFWTLCQLPLMFFDVLPSRFN